MLTKPRRLTLSKAVRESLPASLSGTYGDQIESRMSVGGPIAAEVSLSSWGVRFFLQRSFLDLENRVVSRFGESTESSRMLVVSFGMHAGRVQPARKARHKHLRPEI